MTDFLYREKEVSAI